MTNAEAIDRAVAIMGNERYRHLASPANDLAEPNSPADWVRFCREVADRGGPPPPVDYGSAAAPCGNCPDNLAALAPAP